MVSLFLVISVSYVVEGMAINIFSGSWILPHWILYRSQTMEEWYHKMSKQDFLKQEPSTALPFCISTASHPSDSFPPSRYRILLFVSIALDNLNYTEFCCHWLPLCLIFSNILLFHTNLCFDFAPEVTNYVWPSLTWLSSSPPPPIKLFLNIDFSLWILPFTFLTDCFVAYYLH